MVDLLDKHFFRRKIWELCLMKILNQRNSETKHPEGSNQLISLSSWDLFSNSIMMLQGYLHETFLNVFRFFNPSPSSALLKCQVIIQSELSDEKFLLVAIIHFASRHYGWVIASSTSTKTSCTLKLPIRVCCARLCRSGWCYQINVNATVKLLTAQHRARVRNRNRRRKSSFMQMANGMRSEKLPEIEFNYEAVITSIWLRKFNHRAFPAPASHQSINKVVMVISARLEIWSGGWWWSVHNEVAIRMNTRNRKHFDSIAGIFAFGCETFATTTKVNVWLVEGNHRRLFIAIKR